jgi:single-strand DNA-binding protein
MSFEANGVGRFVRDPELRNVGQTVVCDFALATDEVIKGGAEKKKITSFFNCVVWDKAAEVITKYCKKGDRIHVRGVLRQDKWEDKTTGQKRDKVLIRVTDFEFLGDGRKSEDKEPAAQGDAEGAPF